MKNLSLLAIIYSVLLMTSCETELFSCLKEEGDKEWQEISLESFHSVDLPEGSKVTFKQGEQNVMVFTTSNLIDALVENGSVENGVWRAKVADCVRGLNTVEYIITLPMLESIKISGAADIFTEGAINLNTLDIDVSGIGTFDIKLDTVQVLNIKANGVGRFKMAGFAKALQLNISGSGIINNFDLITETCDIKISGAGECEVNVLNELKVDFSGTGKVCYKGNPSVDTNISGTGQVNDCN